MLISSSLELSGSVINEMIMIRCLFLLLFLNRIYERVVEKPYLDLPLGTAFWLGQRNNAHGYFKVGFS